MTRSDVWSPEGDPKICGPKTRKCDPAITWKVLGIPQAIFKFSRKNGGYILNFYFTLLWLSKLTYTMNKDGWVRLCLFCNGPYSRDVLIVWGCIRLVGNLKDIPPFAKKKTKHENVTFDDEQVMKKCVKTPKLVCFSVELFEVYWVLFKPHFWKCLCKNLECVGFVQAHAEEYAYLADCLVFS